MAKGKSKGKTGKKGGNRIRGGRGRAANGRFAKKR